MRLCLLVASLDLAGCDEPRESAVPVEVLPAPAKNEPVDAEALKSTAVVPDDKPGEAVHKLLDLSMPLQNGEERESFPVTGTAPGPLLPDLFEQPSNQNERSINLRGKVLMDQGGEQTLDSLEGGQLIIEMKNR
jgi:hypothetical protein